MLANQPGKAATAPGKRDDWLVPWRFALLLVLLIVVCFPLVVAGLEAFAYLDSGFFAYPVASYLRESFWRGEIPLWNPLNYCGTPFLAQWNTMTLYPLSLFYVLLPLPWSFGVFCLGHFMLAGLGMYFLAHRWTGNRLAAAVAGAAFAFNGLSWYALMWPHFLAALAWMPWVVLSAGKAWREGRRCLVLAALASAMQLLTGGAEVILQTWFLVGVLWLAQMFKRGAPRAVLAGRTLAVGGLAAGLAAAQLLPFLDLLGHSQRNPGYANSSMAAMPLAGFANYLVPLFHTHLSPQGVPLLGNQMTWTSSYYLGVGVLALALFAVWRVRDNRVRLLTAVGLFGLVMALGDRGLVYDWVTRIFPLLGTMRFPVKFLLLPTFILPLLAAFGLAKLQSAPAQYWPAEWRKAGVIAAVLAALMLIVVWFAWHSPLPGDNAAATTVNAVVRAVFLALMFGAIALLRAETNPRRQRLFQAALVLVVWFDVFTHAPNLSPTVAQSVLAPDTIRLFFNWQGELRPGTSRAQPSRASLQKMLSTGSPDAELDITGRRLSLFLNFNLLDHVAKVDGFYSLDLQRTVLIAKQTWLGTNESAGLKDFLGISHTTHPTNMVDWTTRSTFLPLVTAGQKPVFVGDTDTINALLADDFNGSRVVYLPEEARGQLHVTKETSAHILSPDFANHRLKFDVEADAPAMVVVAQAFYHPWHAYVDGNATPIRRGNYGFQALEVPAGRHSVRLVYEDRKFHEGLAVSIASMLGCAALWFGRRGPGAARPSQG